MGFLKGQKLVLASGEKVAYLETRGRDHGFLWVVSRSGGVRMIPKAEVREVEVVVLKQDKPGSGKRFVETGIPGIDLDRCVGSLAEGSL